ncbi:hypothetical protein F5Y05DRAFT_409744 [Hypoxylon sp. FL0543]|nr:hypothetical protein F5Y05DRAFT_409744 [Hypoxylon sp. FL0543]
MEYLQRHFKVAMARYHVWDGPELVKHLECAFRRVEYYAMEPLREALEMEEPPALTYMLLRRYPADRTMRPGISPACVINLPSDYRDFKSIVHEQSEGDATIFLIGLVQKIIAVFRDIDNKAEGQGVPWDSVLVVGFRFLDHDDITYPLVIQSRSRYVFLMTGDEKHIVLHDTCVPDEAKAIALYQPVVLQQEEVSTQGIS